MPRGFHVPNVDPWQDKKRMIRTKKIAKSSVHTALNKIGDRWNHLIIQEAFRGNSKFEDILAQTGASRNTLSSRLRSLVAHGILEKRVHKQGGTRQSYQLTECGRDLFDSMVLASSWGLRWDASTPNGPSSIVHTGCGKAMLPTMACQHCGGDITLHSCRQRPGPGAGFEELAIPRLHRRRHAQAGSGHAAPPGDVADFIADRWTAMILATQYFGIHRFDDIQSALEIATNILTDRLRALVASGIFERRIYEMSPPRYEYHLTTKGKELYPHALALMQWAERWYLDGELPPVIVTHMQCQHELDFAVVCSECREPLSVETVVERRSRDKNPGS